MLNKTKQKLDQMVQEYPEYSASLVRLKPMLEVATDLSKEKTPHFRIIRNLVLEVRASLEALEILSQYN